MAYSSTLQLEVDGRSGERNLRRFEGSLNRVERSGDTASRAVRGLQTAVTALAAAAGGLTFGRAISQVAQFEDTMQGLKAVSQATSSQMAALERQSRELGATTQFTAQQAGQAQRFLAQAGLEVNEVLSSTPGVLELATAGQLDLARAADLTSNVLGGMRLEVEEIGRVNDVLAATASGANTSVEQLGGALSRAAPLAATAGISLEEVSAAIGAISDAGIQGERAGTGILGFIRQLSRITPQAEDALSNYGLTADDVSLETNSLTEVLERLRAANISTSDAFRIFQSEAAPAAQVLTQNVARVQELTDSLESAEGRAEEMAMTIEEGLGNSLRTFTAAVSESTLQVGDSLAPAFESLVDAASGVLAEMNGMGSEFAEANNLTQSQIETQQRLASALDTTGEAATVVAGIFGARLAGALASNTVAFASAQVQAIRYQATLASMAGVSRTAAVGLTTMGAAARGASGALALVGGPAGAAVLAAGALFYYRDELDGTAAQARETARAVDDFTNALNMSNEAALRSTLGDLRQEMSEVERQQERAQQRLENARSSEREQQLASQANGRPVRATSGVGQAEEDLQEANQQATILSEKIEVVEDRLDVIGDSGVEKVNNVRDAMGEAGGQAEQASGSAQKFADELERVRRTASPARAELMDLGANLDVLSRSNLPTDQVRQIQIGLIDAADSGSVLVESFNALDDAASQAGQDSGEQIASGIERQTTRIGDSLADALMKGEWGGVGDTIGAAVGSSLSDSIASNVSDMAGGSMGRMAGGILGGVAGGLAGQLIGNQVSDLLSSDLPERGALAEQRQEQQFTNTILGDIETQTSSITESTDQMVRALDDLVGANRAMLQSLQSSQRSQSRFTSSALRGMGGANFGAVDIGALAEAGNTLSGLSDDLIGVFDAITLGANSLLGIDDLVGDALGSIFGGGTSLQDRGIEVIGGQIEDLIRGTVVNAYETVEVDGGFFGSDSTERAERRIGGQIEQQFGNAISGITDSLVATAETLGMDAGRAASQLEDMQIRTRNISLLDMNADERQEAIQSYFSSVFDRLSGRLFDWTRQFQEAGEGLGETVTRLATQNEVLRESHAQLGFVLNEGAMNAREFTGVADDFVATLGGVEAAASQISSFQSSFMTEAQQLESVEGQLNRAMEQVNLSLPNTRAGFLDLLQAQNAATEGGQRNIETILRVQDQADQYYSLLESRQSDAIAEVESAMQSMERQVGQVRSALDSLGSSAAQQEMARLDAVDTLRNALATGDLTGVGEAAQAAANINASQFSTREQFERARGVTANLLSAVEARGENQISAAERQVDLAEQANTLSQGQLDSLERIERALTGSSVATFADGGMHSGGARIVGERGPEIEFTGPSRIASNSESRDLLSMDQVISELRQLRSQIDRLNQLNYQTTKNTGKTNDRLRRWDNAGQPPKREAI